MDKQLCIGRTFDLDIRSTFWGKLEGIWGNPGEIPHIEWKIAKLALNDRVL